MTYRFERFRNIELDFKGVDEIGQAFADELFRVYARAQVTLDSAAYLLTAGTFTATIAAHSPAAVR